MKSIDDMLSDQDHYLGHTSDLPNSDKMTQAFIATATFSKELIRSLLIDANDGAVVPMLMPSSAATAAEKAEAALSNNAEEVLGEHQSQKSKITTTFTSVNELVGMQSYLAHLQT